MQHLPRPMNWLENGVPLTLLVDLLDPSGPDSARVLEAEPADTAWVPHLDDDQPHRSSTQPRGER